MNWFAKLPFGAQQQTTAPAAPPAPAAPAAAPAPAEPSWEEKLAATFQKGVEAKSAAPTTKPNPFAALTPEALSAALKSASFVQSVDPNKLLAAAGGNQETALAFAGLLDDMYRTVLQKAAESSVRVAQHGIESTMEHFVNTELPQRVSGFLAADSLQTANPLASNPALKGMFDLLLAGSQASTPNASRQEHIAHVNSLMAELGKNLTASATPSKQAGASGFSPAGAPSAPTGTSTDVFGADFFQNLSVPSAAPAAAATV